MLYLIIYLENASMKLNYKGVKYIYGIHDMLGTNRKYE